MTQQSACPDQEDLRRLAAGELSEREAEPLEEHVLVCLACAEQLDALQTCDPFTKEVQAASANPAAGDPAAEDLIERLIRTPPDALNPLVRGIDEVPADRRRRLLQEAEARRRLLAAQAREGNPQGHEPLRSDASVPDDLGDILALDAALDRLQEFDHELARLVQLRYFGGLTLVDAADILKISPRSAERSWMFARAWLHREIRSGSPPRVDPT